MEPLFFEDATAFRAWLAEHHGRETELIVGFHKKATNRASLNYPEALDQALCFGWIDGVRRSLDESSYTNRFSPRTRRSVWSAVNIRRVGELEELGLMTPAGRAAFEARSQDGPAPYSHEQETREFEGEHLERLQSNDSAWAFWQAQPPGYRKTATWWVVSAKQEATRSRRLDTLIADSAAGRRIDAVTSPANREAR